MEPFRIHILGCGSATPTLKHHCSSQVVEIRGKCFMVDCGEGTQMQLRQSRIKFTRINTVFISHLHGDHCFGLIGMISTFGMLGRIAPLHVYAPAELGPMLQSMLDLFCTGLEYEVVFHPLDCNEHKIVYDDRSITVETIPLSHRVPCCGFLFREKFSNRHINREMIDFYEVPLSQLNNIRAGADWTTPDGDVVPNEKLTRPADPVRSYAYCSDTRYLPKLHTVVKDVDLLYHESTYGADAEDRARLYYHSTAQQAARVALDANAGKLMLGHFSSRYENEECLLDEARKIFSNTILANEGMAVSV